MEACRVMGDVVRGGGEVVQPSPVHVRHVPGGVSLAVPPRPGGEGGAPEGHDVLVLILRVPYMEEKGAEG